MDILNLLGGTAFLINTQANHLRHSDAYLSMYVRQQISIGVIGYIVITKTDTDVYTISCYDTRMGMANKALLVEATNVASADLMETFESVTTIPCGPGS